MKKAIVIMAKFPEAGRVKTRLQPFLSAEKSAEIALAFLQDAENKAKSVCENLIIAFSPPEQKVKFKSILQHENILIEQTGVDLGERMFNAFKFAFFNNLDSVVIIGTDSPTCPAEFIKQAFEFLQNSDAVLGESEDGGYYLIGLNTLRKEIFENVEWSSEKTFEQTVRNIKNLDLSLSLLPKWYDVDFPEDLKRLKTELRENPELAPKTAKWLNEMNKINYNNKKFASISNSETGEVSGETVFYYRQKDDLVWAEYSGGAIIFGTLIAKVLKDNCLEMRYQHLNKSGELMTGKCFSTPEILADGRIRLFEKWQWTCADFSTGESIIEEIRNQK